MIWTDRLVKEFVKVATQGSWGKYHDCVSIDKKIKRFKSLKEQEK